MEALTTIRKILAGNEIFVPNYQRAYSWDTEVDKTKTPKQVNTFIKDLEEYNLSGTTSKYYFGHFLFEEVTSEKFAVVDGQQRLTTIIIFLSALFSKLEKLGELSEEEDNCKEDMIKRKSKYRFDTVSYDSQIFKDYVIDKVTESETGLETESAKRIVNAFNYFTSFFENKDKTYLVKMLDTIQNASCTTHKVTDPSEAIQMFIFQNDRGKKPSNLEMLKSEFMFHIHLYAKDDKENLIKEIQNRFEAIYKSISSIEYKIKEDDVLLYTSRVYFNSLWENNVKDKIAKELTKDNAILTIQSFTHALAKTFTYLKKFFNEDEKTQADVHSLITLSNIGIAIPFIIKAYDFNLSKDELSLLCKNLEAILLRHRIIGTRAELESRINDVYQNFKKENKDITPIVNRIDWMIAVDSKTHHWWAYWNNENFERALQGWVHQRHAKFLLWKYEQFLASSCKREEGYSYERYEHIKEPQLEHIAPQTENPENGYEHYDKEFRNSYLECLGNYLLISASHNKSIGNIPFVNKRESYNILSQQREIQNMTKDEPRWTKALIQERKEKIVSWIVNNF